MKRFTTTRLSAWTSAVEHRCCGCHQTFRSEHAAAFHDCEPSRLAAERAEFNRLEDIRVTEKIQAEKMTALETALIAECERAMKQRDEFLKTGKSTAGHGGSHDTLFGFILRQHGVKF